MTKNTNDRTVLGQALAALPDTGYGDCREAKRILSTATHPQASEPAPSTAGERNPLKVEFTKEWCLAAAELEAGHDVTVGQPAQVERAELLRKFERAVGRKDVLHAGHMGKAMPDDVYQSFARLRDETIPALRAALLQTTPVADDARTVVPSWLLKTTQDLAVNLARKHYPEVKQFKVLDDLAGVISQIDNMTTGLSRARTGGLTEAISEAEALQALNMIGDGPYNQGDVEEMMRALEVFSDNRAAAAKAQPERKPSAE